MGFSKPSDQQLELISLNMNEKISFDSEILIEDGQIYVPLRQIGELTDTVFKFDREYKVLEFVHVTTGAPVKIDFVNSTLELDGSEQDSTQIKNIIYSPFEPFVISREDILVHIDLVKDFLDINLTYNTDALILNLQIDRVIEILKPHLTFKDDNNYEKQYAKPNKELISFRTIQANLNSQASRRNNVVQGVNNNEDLQLENTLNLNITGNIAGGQYRVGPSLYFSPERATLWGFEQTWTKKFKDNLALEIGNTHSRIGEITMPSSNILGARIGSPRRMNFVNQDNISFQGQCDIDSEVKLLLNDAQIARQVCRTGSYNFTRIPRLLNPDNRYSVVQTSTDGTETVLRDEVLSYFNDLLPKGRTDWEVSAGKMPRRMFVNLWGDDVNQTVQPPNKYLLGATYRYGIGEKTNVGFAVAADPLFKVDQSQNRSLNDGFLQNFNNLYTQSGVNASFNVSHRVTNKLGIHLENAFSLSQDKSLTQNYRKGFGFGSLLDYNYRNAKFNSQGRFYYFSPQFYSPSNLEANRIGMNVSGNFKVKDNFVNFNYQGENRNMDGRSRNGRSTRQTVNIAHSKVINSKLNLRNNINYRNNEVAGSVNGLLRTRSALTYRHSKDLRLTASTGVSYQQLGETFTNGEVAGYDGTAGFSYRFKNKDQINSSVSGYSTGQVGVFGQYRKQIGPWVYEPSFNLLFAGKSGSIESILSNGVYYEQSSGMRVGAQYIISRSANPLTSTAIAPLNVLLPSDNSKIVTNHSVVLSLIAAVGVLDKKAHLLANTTNAGYLKGRVFLDLNDNGKQDKGERGVANIPVVYRSDKKATTDKLGNFVLADIPEGLHEVSIDTENIPFLLSVIGNEKAYFEIGRGSVTEIQYRLTMNSATVEGHVNIQDASGKPSNTENLVVIAYNLDTDKEAGYTYTDSKGYYVISELKPGNYRIEIDPGDVKRKNLKPASDKYSLTQELEIPIDFEDFIEIEGIDFHLMKTVF